MSDEEIMKQFQEAMRDEEVAKEQQPDVAPYRATTNLNTQIGNPNVSFDNPMGMNIQNNNDINNSNINVEEFSPKTTIPSNNNPVEDIPTSEPDIANPMSLNIQSDLGNSNINQFDNTGLNNNYDESNTNVNNNISNNEDIANPMSLNIQNDFENNNINQFDKPELNSNIFNNNEDTFNDSNNSQFINGFESNNQDNNEESSYAATDNLNVAIGNPTLDVANPMSLNIENDNSIDNSELSSEYVPDVIERYYPGNTSNRVFVSDSARRHKKKTIKITEDTKVMFIIVIALFIFISCLPMIYDFFRLIRSKFIG